MTGPEAAAEGSGGGQELTTAAWVVAKLREGHGIVAGSDRARATADLIEELGGRVAALEAALRSVVAATKDGSLDDVAANARVFVVTEDALAGGTAALDAAVAKAVLAERARIRVDAKLRIVRLHLRGKMILADVLDAIDAAGGAP